MMINKNKIVEIFTLLLAFVLSYLIVWAFYNHYVYIFLWLCFVHGLIFGSQISNIIKRG